MREEIEKNLKICDEILDKLARLSDSDANESNTWLQIGDIETDIMELKKLYRQIII